MTVSSLRIQNFRSFGPEPVEIRFGNETTFVGANGSGKSAALEALVRLFGASASDRRLTRSDFHLPAGANPGDIDEMQLCIEARLAFPELAAQAAQVAVDAAPQRNAVPECFNQMTIQGPGGALYCRVRLEATWRRTHSPEGEIDEAIYWITTDATEPQDEEKEPMLTFDRARIQVVYVPASRDPIRQLRQVSGSLLYRLLRAVRWSENVNEVVAEASAQLRTAFQGEAGVATIETAIAGAWRTLHQFEAYSEVALQPVSSQLEDLLRKVEVAFRPGDGGTEQGIERLSDGLKSLFYFSLVGAAFDIEEAARADGGQGAAILAEELRLPSLSIFAVEEAENHLAPHYLGRILALLRRMAQASTAQVILTSQSPSILHRIEPDTVRHFRLTRDGRTTAVRALTLPDAAGQGEAYKYVKEAVRAFPELYFASLVVLGEGDSEEIALPRLAAARNFSTDVNFVSIVPLGGRHVNHFWRLLSDLSIPFVTLLDLDRERFGGGWSRVKYACQQLISNGRDRAQVLNTTQGPLAEADFQRMHEWDLDVAGVQRLNAWVTQLEQFDVFFSAPLDLDFLMLSAFPAAYHAATDGTGPRIPTEGTPEFTQRLEQARAATLKPQGSDGSTFSAAEREAFIWYAYLFLGRGKPATHILALNAIDDATLRDHAPGVLRRMVERMRLKLEPAPATP